MWYQVVVRWGWFFRRTIRIEANSPSQITQGFPEGRVISVTPCELARFRYSGMDCHGVEYQGVVEGYSIEDVSDKLRAEGIFVTQMSAD